MYMVRRHGVRVACAYGDDDVIVVGVLCVSLGSASSEDS
jgi:hypothetical protein